MDGLVRSVGATRAPRWLPGVDPDCNLGPTSTAKAAMVGDSGACKSIFHKRLRALAIATSEPQGAIQEQ